MAEWVIWVCGCEGLVWDQDDTEGRTDVTCMGCGETIAPRTVVAA
jgi:ribosomal protein S27E